MKKIFLSGLAISFSLILFAQRQEFEGTIVYKTDVKSKSPGVSDKVWKSMLAYGDSLTIVIKRGNFRRTSNVMTEYYLPQKEKVFIKFKGIDTLFYRNYSSDTTTLIAVSKTEEHKRIAGLECNAVVIKTPSSTVKYFYSPSLYLDPEYSKNNKIGRYDVYAKEAESVWLASSDETESYTVSQTCIRLEQSKIDDSVFELPKLPEKEFSIESITTAPEFNRSGGWIKYLQTNLNNQIGVQYLKIPKGETSASQTVWVTFVVSEKGEVLEAKVENKEEVHRKLAEEALRVITESRGWKPATMLGQKIRYWLKQPITFEVSK